MELNRKRLTLFSPAKVNLFFRVLGKRKDGYHEVATLMQALSFGDTLQIECNSSDQLTSSSKELPCDTSNLVWQALALFRKKTGLNFSVHIHLDKRIPLEAGLGGGSSNVATTFWGLNELASRLVPVQELQEWAGEISSDAPFFFSSGTAYATGRNECVRDLDPLPPNTLVIAKPSWGLSTSSVYHHCSLKKCSLLDPMKLLEAFLSGNMTPINDLEWAACSLRPELKKTKEKLLHLGFSTVSMTGSGSAFYCLGDVENSKLPGISFFPTSFLSREKERWFLPNPHF